MKISVEHYDNKYEFTLPDDLTLDEVVIEMEKALKCMGYNFEGELTIIDPETGEEEEFDEKGNC